jgi:cytokinesis protein
METIFGRKKPRSRQVSAELNERSVPYERVTQSGRTPLPVGTVSNGIRNAHLSQDISAPLQNPTLTRNGTEMNFAGRRSRAQRESGQSEGSQRPTSPPASLYSANSMSSNVSVNASRSTRHTMESSASSGASSVTPTSPYTTSSQRMRDVEGTPRGRHSGMGDFGHLGSPTSSSFERFPYNGATVRPSSMATSRSDPRSSRYPSSIFPSDTNLSHGAVPHQPPKYASALDDEFRFPRPKTSREIEKMFDEVQTTRNIPNPKQLNDLSIEHKWLMVYNDELERWREEKRRMTEGKGQAKDSPEWFLKKFMDQTIQPRQVAGLAVSLRTMPVQ